MIAAVNGLDSAVTLTADAEPVAANTRVSLFHDAQQSPIATALPDHVGIRVTDSTGRALPNVPVRWETLDSGTVMAGAARTDSLGAADASWVLGPVAGRQRLRVSIGNGRLVKPAVLHALAIAGPATTIRVVRGSGQRVPGGSMLPKPIALRIANAAGNPVSGVRVALKLSAGSVPDSAPVTDSLGLVKPRWTLPSPARTDTCHLQARVDGVVQPADVVAIAQAKAKPPAAARHRHG